MLQPIIVFCNCGSEGEADQIAQNLVDHRIAACVNISAPVRSVYRWLGKVETATEWTLTAKTTAERFDELARTIRSLHSYELPEIIAVPIVTGAPDYLKWIEESVHE